MKAFSPIPFSVFRFSLFQNAMISNSMCEFGSNLFSFGVNCTRMALHSDRDSLKFEIRKKKTQIRLWNETSILIVSTRHKKFAILPYTHTYDNHVSYINIGVPFVLFEQQHLSERTQICFGGFHSFSLFLALHGNRKIYSYT